MADNSNYREYRDKQRMALFVRTIRKSRKMTRAALAEKAGYESTSKITEIENGSRLPAYERIADLANALDVSIEQLKGFGRIEVTEKGYAKLRDNERIALYLFAPVIKGLPDEDIRYLADTALLLCLKNGITPDWGQTEYQKKAGAPKEEISK